jgi:hypothetical protein
MGMTWGSKVRSVAFAVAFIACVALASGANWVTAFDGLGW